MDIERIKKKIYARIDELPTLPAVIPRLIKLMENPDSDTEEVTEAISHDPALTSKILKVANSAYYGFPQKITSLDRAVALLGFNMVKSLALSVGVIRCLPKSSGTGDFTAKGLWTHSLAVATVAKGLCEKTGKFDQGEISFVIGLLHDIGKLVLNEFFSDLFQVALSSVAEDNTKELCEAEREFVGLDHAQVGGILLKRWKFPESIRIPIAFHHRPGDYEGEYEKDILMLRIADCVSRDVGLGEAGNPVLPDIGEEDMERLGLTSSVLDDLKSDLDRARDGIYGFFDAIN